MVGTAVWQYHTAHILRAFSPSTLHTTTMSDPKRKDSKSDSDSEEEERVTKEDDEPGKGSAPL